MVKKIRNDGIWDWGIEGLGIEELRDWEQRAEAILDCAHVKSALPFHIRENLTPVEHPEGTPVKYASLLQEQISRGEPGSTGQAG
jgi:hypothetical protein